MQRSGSWVVQQKSMLYHREIMSLNPGDAQERKIAKLAQSLTPLSGSDTRQW